MLKWTTSFHVLMVKGWTQSEDGNTVLTLVDTNEETDPFGLQEYEVVVTPETQEKGIGAQTWRPAKSIHADVTDSIAFRFTQRGDDTRSSDTGAGYSASRMRQLTLTK